ncbi:hypothetical protein SLEP1_g9660 [Rubroshorea leprosula]|uniref:Retrotransposon gag domain-containing protein n=1 Tax=Rubroshorea leprosula TaxID=152421 RepID=A0AAV5IE26_9ROSI|nr:hypothetical protein SLEP1_g9660 [Rubroshorea leprosula]
MVRTFTGECPPRNEIDEQEDDHVSEAGLNDFRPMPRNLFVGGAEQDYLSETDDERTPTGYATQPEQFQAPTGTRQRSARPNNSQRERPERSAEPARTTELEERTRVLEMAMGRILARLIPDDPLIPLLNRDAQPAAVVATRNSPALSNIVVPTRPRGSGKLNVEPSSSKYSEELMRKNADLERQLRDVQKSIDELKSPRSHQQTLDLDSAPLNLSITAEPYQEGFKIPHLETYDGTKDPDEHLHTYQAIMRIQNANDAMMCKVFPATLKSTARRWYHKLPRHSIDSFSQLAKLFSNKFASQREIKRTATELMQVSQKEGESLRDYMQRFNKATLDIDNVPDTICLSALLHGLRRGRFLDDLLENPPRTWNEVNDRSASFILSEDFQSSKRRADDKPSRGPEQQPRREEKKKQKHWVRRPPPPLHDSSRADKTKHCDYHRVYGHNTEDCQHLKDELEFLARNGKLEGYVQKPHTQQPTQTHFVQAYDRPQGQRYQHGGTQDAYQDSLYPSEQGRAYRGRPFNRRGQGPRTTAPNQKDRKGVGYAEIPPPSGTINMISGGVHSGGQSARARKAYARQVMTVNKDRPLKRPFEEAEWENTPITFSPSDYKRAEGEPDIMMPHADPFVATVHIGNHNVNKVFIDTGSSPDILYWGCFQKMQLNPSSLQKHEGPIYGFDNQPVPVEGVITLPIYVGSEPRFRMASVTFLVVKMESAFNAILGRATLCELKAVVSQPHLCMKFPTPQGVGVLKGNQKMARACYQDTFKKVELVATPASVEGRKPTQLGQQTMSISDIEHRPESVEQKAEPVEPVETVPLNPDVPERTVKIGTKLTDEERAELLEFLRNNQDVFAWTTDEMPGVPAELTTLKFPLAKVEGCRQLKCKGPRMELTLVQPDDWHLHLRDGELLLAIVPHRAIVIPNLKPPVTTTAAAVTHRESILKALPTGSNFNPLMTLYLTDTTSPDEIRLARSSKVVFAVKLYPAGATTNSQDGVTDLFGKCLPVLEQMVEHNMPLLVHGEVTDPSVDVFNREKVFINTVLQPLIQRLPKLKVVMEHITTMDAVRFVESCEGGIPKWYIPRGVYHLSDILFFYRSYL